MSRFASVDNAPPIEVFHVNRMCLADTSATKINLSIGAYRTEQGLPCVLEVVREAEHRLANDSNQNHEYLPVTGFEPFCRAAAEVLLGSTNSLFAENKVVAIQTLSGTGGLRLGADFLAKMLGMRVVSVSKPTWGNHKSVFKNAGFTDVKDYSYWHAASRSIDFDGYLKDLEALPENAVVILHACAHNPTGMDLNQDQWKQVCQVVQRKKIFPFFDCAYQGFATGDLDADAWAVRYFASQGIELMASQSFAKNFGLYNERIGNLVMVVNDSTKIAAIISQITLIVRANYSNPPNHGAKVVHMVLTTPELTTQWHGHIREMSGRIKQMRLLLKDALINLGTPGNWDHITSQIGMFSYTGLNVKQCEVMQQKHHVYLLSDGRINMCGLNTKNVDYMAKAMCDVVKNV